MLDTNVLISAALFPSKSLHRMLDNITQNHTLVLSSFVIEELNAVVAKKFPNRLDALDRFYSKLSFELVYTPHKMKGNLFKIRDINDYPVLYSAIIENVDVLITGDKDFDDVQVERPEIISPSNFLKKYC